MGGGGGGFHRLWDPLYLFTSFRYLGRVLLVDAIDWPAVVRNLHESQQKWTRLARVLRRERTDDRTSGQIYLALVQLVLL